MAEQTEQRADKASVKCNECFKVYQQGSMTRHFQKLHPGKDKSYTYIEEIGILDTKTETSQKKVC